MRDFLDAEMPPGVEAIQRRPEGDALRRLHDDVRTTLHAHRHTLLYHGWPHARFVTKNALSFAHEHGVDERTVGAAGLVHDLNYLVEPDSEPELGFGIIRSKLHAAGFGATETAGILEIISEAYMGTRGPTISPAAACLSDADSLFKALPFTPLLLARAYINENGVTLRELATKILDEQLPLIESDNYFYLDNVRIMYSEWAKGNVLIWRRTLEALDDEELEWLAEQLLAIDSDFGNVQ